MGNNYYTTIIYCYTLFAIAVMTANIARICLICIAAIHNYYIFIFVDYPKR